LFDSEKNILLIGGTSHTGKSTLAGFLSSKLKLKSISTDSLARHPGRPWKEMPEKIPMHVQEHYFNLSVNELLVDVVKHYEKIWPIVVSVIQSDTNGLILEGSALLPKIIQQISGEKISAAWLTSTDSFLKQRIYKSSGYFHKTRTEKYLVDKFLNRTLAFNNQVMQEVKELNLPFVEVEKFANIEDLADECFG
jgi:2-phosphoglycerate kinase